MLRKARIDAPGPSCII